MESGYSYAVVARNINTLISQGIRRREAIARAFAHSRVCFFKAHPKGALPEWLAYPFNYRLREHYTPDGEPVGRFKRNPDIRSKAPAREVAQAKKLFADFTGKKPGSVRRMKLAKAPKAGLAFGTLVQIGYVSARDGQKYRHTFSKKSRPLLIAASDGKSVHIVGGRYAFTDRGIEDR
jgi:hypothetical protein